MLANDIKLSIHPDTSKEEMNFLLNYLSDSIKSEIICQFFVSTVMIINYRKKNINTIDSLRN